MAIQNAGAKPFQQILAQEVLGPLRLASVQFDRPGLGAARRPSRYSWYDLSDFHELIDRPQLVPDWDYSHNLAGGGLIANVEDLTSFGGALRAPGLMNQASLDLIWTRPEVNGVKSSMSFGWFPKENPSRISINGSNAGVQAGRGRRSLTTWFDSTLLPSGQGRCALQVRFPLTSPPIDKANPLNLSPGWKIEDWPGL